MKNKIYYIFICLFLLIITAPFWGIGIHGNSNNNEKRNLTTITDIKGIKDLNEYISDNHGFRNTLSDICLSFYVNYMKESPIPERVQLGTNDFLYVGNLQNNTYDVTLGVAKFKEDDVQFAYNNILQVQQFFKDLDIDFYFVIAPNKTTIYPEYLKLKPNHRPRLTNEIIKRIEQTDINLIDLRSFVKDQKNRDILYYKHDIHWNKYAGFLATQEILKTISKNHNIRLINEDDYTITKYYDWFDGDLSNMLNIKSKDYDYNITPKNPIIRKDTLLIEDSNGLQLFFSRNKSINNGVKALVLRDSFFYAMYQPFMHSVESASVFRSMNVNVKIKKEDILNEIARAGKPDFVIYEILERHVNLVAIR